MVLSNLNSSVDVEARTMATMGDTLGKAHAECEGPCGDHTQPCAPLAALVFLVHVLGYPGDSPRLTLDCFTVSSASKGLLDAAHFCYLMAQVGFGVYTKKTTKLVLIGSNHR